MNYRETLDYLYRHLPMFQRIGKDAFKKDLINTLTLCKELDNPQRKFRSIHIAGTNGKGSSAHMLSAVLQSAGYKVGLYTSPHLKEFTERIRINGRPIPESEITLFVNQYQTLIESIDPSFFEVAVVMAFNYFAKQEVDMAIIETGLGGRLDSTNVIIPEVSLITNIGWDHQDMLGNTLKQIAIEKAGIIKKGVPVVIGEKQPELTRLFENIANERGARITFSDEEMRIDTISDGNFQVSSSNSIYPLEIKLSLHGRYQKKNLPGVLTTLRILSDKGYHIRQENIKEGLKNIEKLTGLKGRWQILSSDKPRQICDVAHNEDGIKAVISQLISLHASNMHIVWGMVKDKEINKLLRLLPKDGIYYFCQAQIPRALPVGDLKEIANSIGLMGKAYSSVNKALKSAREKASKNDVIFIGGSTFVVAEIDEL